MDKHAFLIIAHNQFQLLEMILRLLDDEKNDFYIHIAKEVDFDIEYFSAIPKYSKITFVERAHISWGDFSMVDCELTLLNAATPKKYAYYHLISGVDLPLKTSDELHLFFKENSGKQFIHFCSDQFINNIGNQERIRLYHPLQSIIGRKRNFLWLLKRVFLYIQKFLGVNRLKNSGLTLKFGSQWFSITDELATYLCEQEATIKKYFKNTYIPDEAFLQTLFYSKYSNSDILYKSELGDNYLRCVRLIDWERGNPYIFRRGDLDELLSSPCMFARKFDLSVDSQICQALYEHLMRKSGKI